jgi:hypothetical protein
MIVHLLECWLVFNVVHVEYSDKLSVQEKGDANKPRDGIRIEITTPSVQHYYSDFNMNGLLLFRAFT